METAPAEQTEKATRRASIVEGLRQLANFLEGHPDVAAPYNVQVNAFVETREELTAAAKALGWQKVYLQDWFCLKRSFAPDEAVTLEVNAPRERVCRRVVVGKKIIPARDAQVVDEIEWVCDDVQLLGRSSEQEPVSETLGDA